MKNRYSENVPVTKADWEKEVKNFLTMLKLLVDDDTDKYARLKYVIQYTNDRGHTNKILSVDVEKGYVVVIESWYDEKEEYHYTFEYPKESYKQDRYYLWEEMNKVRVFKAQKYKKLFSESSQRKLKIKTLLK